MSDKSLDEVLAEADRVLNDLTDEKIERIRNGETLPVKTVQSQESVSAIFGRSAKVGGVAAVVLGGAGLVAGIVTPFVPAVLTAAFGAAGGVYLGYRSGKSRLQKRGNKPAP